MTRNLTSAAFVAMLFGLFGADVSAAPLTWTINSTASSYTLRIPDQQQFIDGNQATIRVRNQGAGASWTTNVAKLSGTVNTLYDEGAGTIQFVGGQTNISALNSGNYRPNPASWNLNVNNGTFQNTSTAPGVFGGRLAATVLIQTFDLGVFNIYDVDFDLSSDVLPFIMNGNVSLQSGTGTQLGVVSSVFAGDGAPPITLTSSGDFNDENINYAAANKALNGTLTNAGGANRHLVLPLQQNFSFDIQGVPIQANVVGTLVLDAVVPEPATWMLAALGFVSVAACVRRRARLRQQRN